MSVLLEMGRSATDQVKKLMVEGATGAERQ